MTARQGTMFGQWESERLVDPPELPVRDPKVNGAEVPRLGGQNAQILARLRKGKATNAELYNIGRAVNSRISDVRKWLQKYEGKTIVSTCVESETGLYQYEIVEIKS